MAHSPAHRLSQQISRRASSLPSCYAALATGFVAGLTIALLCNVMLRAVQRPLGAEQGGYPYTSRAPLL